MNNAPTKERHRTGSVVAFAWLMLLTVIFAADHVALMRDIESAKGNASQESLAATQNQVGALQARFEALTDSKPVARGDFEAAQRAIGTQLATLEHHLAGSARADVLTPLLERVQTLEQPLARVRRNASTPKLVQAASPSPPTTVLLDPSFSVIGSELRGGERFLSIAPIGAHAIGQLRVMRPGDAEGLWRLEAVDASSATFTVDGIARRIALPQ